MGSRGMISLIMTIAVAFQLCLGQFPGIELPRPGRLDLYDLSDARMSDIYDLPQNARERIIYQYRRHSFHTEGYLHINNYLAKLNMSDLTQYLQHLYHVRMELNSWPRKDPKTRYREYAPTPKIMDDVHGSEQVFRIVKMIKSMDMFLSLARTKEELVADCSDQALDEIEWQNFYSYYSATNMSFGVSHRAHFPLLGSLIHGIVEPVIPLCLPRFTKRIEQTFNMYLSYQLGSKRELLYHAAYDYVERATSQDPMNPERGSEDLLRDMHTFWITHFLRLTSDEWESQPGKRIDRAITQIVFDNLIERFEERTGKVVSSDKESRFQLFEEYFIEPCEQVYSIMKRVFKQERKVLDYALFVKDEIFIEANNTLAVNQIRAVYAVCKIFTSVHISVIKEILFPTPKVSAKPQESQEPQEPQEHQEPAISQSDPAPVTASASVAPQPPQEPQEPQELQKPQGPQPPHAVSAPVASQASEESQEPQEHRESQPPKKADTISQALQEPETMPAQPTPQ